MKKVKEKVIKKTKEFKLVYLASPYSHKDPKVMFKRYTAVTKAAAKLMQMYDVVFFLPITQSHHMVKLNSNMNGGWNYWKGVDLFMISRSDEVWVLQLDGWKESVGVTAEIEYAREQGIRVRYFEPHSLLQVTSFSEFMKEATGIDIDLDIFKGRI